MSTLLCTVQGWGRVSYRCALHKAELTSTGYSMQHPGGPILDFHLVLHDAEGKSMEIRFTSKADVKRIIETAQEALERMK